ncbi:MAG: lactate dehydrogenase, partial [Pedobacter sp.]|nr:lactate dehydrogenase [Pedobacter sp.]
MRVVAYSIKSSEKEPLAIANHKKHEITLISNHLTLETASFAQGKDAVIVNVDDQLHAEVIKKLAEIGVKYIATRSTSVDHIDLLASNSYKIKIASVPPQLIQSADFNQINSIIATQTVLNLDNWQDSGCLGTACVCSRSCDKVHIDAAI